MLSAQADNLRRYLRDAAEDLATAEALDIPERRERKLRSVVDDLENALAEVRWLIGKERESRG